MKLKKIIFITLLLICYNTVHAAITITASEIIAYPVPFNPNQKTLTIGEKAGGSDLSGYSVNVSVYDINGDLIIEKSGSGNIKWNGRNKSGRIVKPGLYILKVEIEEYGNPSNYIKKIIRILIDY